MTVRRILIFAPICLIFILFQSYFWVPTYEQQTRGNPDRLKEYITGSIGDASLLNPILSADSASSEIEDKVFEGLLDYDEELRFQGRLATSWHIYEEAYFYVNESAVMRAGINSSPDDILVLLQKAKQKRHISPPVLKNTLDNITEITLIPPKTYLVRKSEKVPDVKGKKTETTIRVSAPARIRLKLKRVDQDLFQNLTHLLGKTYFDSFDGTIYLAMESPEAKNHLQDYVAEILPAIEHNPVIEFQLRPNIKFHDGHVVDAHDVRFTYEALMNAKNLSPRIADYEPVKSVTVIDPLTVRIVYKRLFSPALGTWMMGILPEHLLNAKALDKEAIRRGKDPNTFSMRDSSFNRNPIGCGPYVFREWKSDQYIMLERFDEYWEGPPNYKRFIYRIIPDLLTQEMEFYAGTLDDYGGGNPPHGVPAHQVERFENDPNYQSFQGSSLGYDYIGYNIRREPFNDLRVRKALSMAIDVDKIIKYVLHGHGERITGPFVKQTEYYNDNIQPIPFDPEGALKLLAEAGWKHNQKGWLEKDGKTFQFTLITNSGNDRRKAILAIAQDAWKQIGIDVHTDLLEWSVFIQERVDKADFDAMVLGWMMSIEPDPFQIWHSSQTNPYQLNFAGFKDKKADELIIKIRQEYDHDKQVQYCHRFHEIIAREQPYTFLYVRNWTAILDNRIVIKDVDNQGRVNYKKITATKIGRFDFHFNKWVKLADASVLAP
jgi:ABC-type transport system substrate-binding protein